MVDLLSKSAGKTACISQNYSTKIVIKILKKSHFAKLERCATELDAAHPNRRAKKETHRPPVNAKEYAKE
jgi:hypothetical protein